MRYTNRQVLTYLLTYLPADQLVAATVCQCVAVVQITRRARVYQKRGNGLQMFVVVFVQVVEVVDTQTLRPHVLLLRTL